MSRAHIVGLAFATLFALLPPPLVGQLPTGRTDLFGDALPPGAIARLGTIRWRTGSSWETSSVLSADGRSIFGGGGETIRVFDLDTGLVLRTIKSPDDSIRALALSPDGKILASGGYKGAFLWDADSGKQIRPLKAGSVAVIAFSPDGKMLITGGEDHERSVRVFDVASGKEQLRLLWHQRRVTLVACGPDNKTLVSASWDNDIRVTDLTTGELIHTFRDKNANDAVVALSPDGKTLALGDMRYQYKQPHWLHTLRFIDVATGKQRPVVDKISDRFAGLIFSPDGRSLIADGREWDVASGKPLRKFAGGGHGRFTPDGRRLVSAGSVIRVWDYESGKELHAPEGPVSSANSLDFSPDGATVASCSFDDRQLIFLWDTATGKLKGSLRGHESYIRAVQFAPDGRLISGGGDSTVRVWDTTAAKEVFQFKLHDPRAGEKPLQVTTMGLSRDGQTLAVASVGFEGGPGKESVHLFAWNTANGKLLVQREGTGSFGEWPGFSADARAVLQRDLVLRDLLTGKQIVKLEPVPQPGGEGVINSDVLEAPYTLSPDGRVVAARGSRQRNEGPRYWRDNYAIVLFDLTTGKEMHRIPIDTWMARAAFSPDGKRLAGADGHVLAIWDTATGKRLWHSPDLDHRVTALAFSPDGTRLASAIDNSTTLIWDVSSTKSWTPR